MIGEAKGVYPGTYSERFNIGNQAIDEVIAEPCFLRLVELKTALKISLSKLFDPDIVGAIIYIALQVP